MMSALVHSAKDHNIVNWLSSKGRIYFRVSGEWVHT